MDIYLIIAIFLLVLALVFEYVKIPQAEEDIVWIILFLSWAALFSLRSISVGHDTRNYYRIYELTSNGILSLKSTTSIEKGFIIIMSLACRIGMGFKGFQFILCFISLGIVFFVSRKCCCRTYLIYLIYSVGAFFNLMNQERSALGAFVCIFALDRLFTKKYLQAIVALIIACSFHFGMISFIPIVIVSILEIKLTKRTLSLFIVISALAYSSISLLVSFLIRISPKYNIYFTDKVRFIKAGNVTYFIFFIVVVIFAIYSKSKAIHHGIVVGDNYDILLWSSITGATISLLVLKISMAQRFMTPILFTIPFLIVEAINIEKSRKRRFVLKLIIAIFFFAYMYIYLYISENGMGRDGIVPYTGGLYE